MSRVSELDNKMYGHTVARCPTCSTVAVNVGGLQRIAKADGFYFGVCRRCGEFFQLPIEWLTKAHQPRAKV